MTQIDIDKLKKLLFYDEKTGNLYWRPREADMFSKESLQKTWNTKYAFKVAGTIEAKKVLIRIGDKRYPIGKVVVALSEGVWPKKVIHLDGNQLNSKIENLRIISREH